MDRRDNTLVDSRSCQNRNIKIVLMLKETPHWKTVCLKYLELGQSYLPNDTDFVHIERALKRQIRIYSFEDFISIMEICNQNKRIVLHVMDSEDFFPTEDIKGNISNRKSSSDKQKVNWLKVKIIKLERQTILLFFKPIHLQIYALKKSKFTNLKERKSYHL